MCGVFGYIGDKPALQVCLKGLEHLEYRGYDSTGIVGIHEGALACLKSAGKLTFLKQKLNLPPLEIAIAHTRWATHGKVNDQNAHPHFDPTGSLAIVHNGIIENFDALKEELLAKGARFASETDSEVIAHLIQAHYKGDLVHALYATLPRLKGVFALALIHKDHPDQIIAAARDCPLSIAFNDAHTESILSSDPNAFLGSALNILFLKGDEIARLKKQTVEIYGKKLELIKKPTERLSSDYTPPSKEGFSHYLLKEIFEQPRTIQKAFLGRATNTVHFEELKIGPQELAEMQNGWILGCGTSSHAGLIASLYLEEFARFPARSEIASEARYRNPLLSDKTLVLALSQSGETADTLAALREARRHGVKALGFCNVKNSTLAREADSTLFLKAGPEVSVCSTKAFTSQLTLLYLFSLHMAQIKGTLSLKAIQAYLDALREIPEQIESILDRMQIIETLAKKYARYPNFFFMGRHYMYPTCLEAALKLKEISYVHANGYPGGELKHGPIALLDAEFPVIAFCANQKTEDKIVSNLMEVKARGAPVLALAPQRLAIVQEIANDTFFLPPQIDELYPLLATLFGQLFAYFIAKERGCEIDQPRNLAKSVTVE